MKKKLEILLNIIHYCIYKVDYKRHLLFNKINPFMLLGKMPPVQRMFEEQGTSQKEVVNKVWGNKRLGFGILISGSILVITLFIMIWAIFLMLNSLLEQPIKFSWQPFTICMGLAYIVCHFTVFQKNKYISYFKQFENWSSLEKMKYGFFSFAFVVGTITLFIYSFRFLPRP